MSGLDRSEQGLDRTAPGRAALGEGAEADGVRGGDAPESRWIGSQVVPGDVVDNGEVGLAGGVESDGYRTGGRRGIRSDSIQIHSAGGKPRPCTASKFIVPHPRDQRRLAAQRLDVAGEIGRCAAQLRSGRQEIPKDLSDAGDLGGGHG